MNFKKQLLAFSVGLTLASPVAIADVGSTLDDWFNDNNNANITSPGVYEGQTAMYGTLGGISTRNEIVEPFNFLQIQTPKFSGGCGGIDAYMGGFTAIDSDQFVESLRAVGQNAKSLAFMLAIQVVSPMLSDVMEDIKSFAEDLKKMSMDSCAAAEALVGGVMQEIGGEKADCIQGRMERTGEDFTTASWECTTGGRRKEDVGSNIASFTRGNIAWYAMMQSNNTIFRSDPAFSEMVMNIIGTVVKQDADPSDSDSGTTPAILPPAVTEDGALMPRGKKIIGALLKGSEGGVMEMRRCISRNVDPTSCDRLEADKSQVSVTYEGMNKKVEDMLSNIMDNIYDDVPLSQEETALVAGARVPLYKYLASAAAAFPRTMKAHNSILQEYTQLIAKDIVLNGLLTSIEQVRDTINNLPNGLSTSEDIKDYRKQLEKVLAAIAVVEKENSVSAEKYIAFQEQIRRYEKQVMGKLSSSIVNSAIWQG